MCTSYVTITQEHMQVILGYASVQYPPLDLAARHTALCSSSSEVNSGLFLSAHLLPETKSSWDEDVCLRGGDVGTYLIMKCL